MERLTESQVNERIQDIANEDFLMSLVFIARAYGWEGDYIEVESFVRWIFDRTEFACPDLKIFETDEFNKTIIP